MLLNHPNTLEEAIVIFDNVTTDVVPVDLDEELTILTAFDDDGTLKSQYALYSDGTLSAPRFEEPGHFNPITV